MSFLRSSRSCWSPSEHLEKLFSWQIWSRAKEAMECASSFRIETSLTIHNWFLEGDDIGGASIALMSENFTSETTRTQDTFDNASDERGTVQIAWMKGRWSSSLTFQRVFYLCLWVRWWTCWSDILVRWYNLENKEVTWRVRWRWQATYKHWLLERAVQGCQLRDWTETRKRMEISFSTIDCVYLLSRRLSEWRRASVWDALPVCLCRHVRRIDREHEYQHACRTRPICAVRRRIRRMSIVSIYLMWRSLMLSTRFCEYCTISENRRANVLKSVWRNEGEQKMLHSVARRSNFTHVAFSFLQRSIECRCALTRGWLHGRIEWF